MTSCAMVVARNRLLGCRAFTVVDTRNTFELAKSMNSGVSALQLVSAPSRKTLPLFSARWEVRLASRSSVQHRAVHSSSGGGAPGESSSPPPGWNLPVPLTDYLALGPRHRQHQQQEDWSAEAADLAASLGIDPPTSIEAQHRRVFHLYLPVYFWLKDLLAVSGRQRGSTSPPPSPSPCDLTELDPPCAESGTPEASNRAGGRTNSPPLVVGISAPQGCGKTTLVSEMKRMLERAGHSCVVVSIDDFYLTGAEQVSPC